MFVVSQVPTLHHLCSQCHFVIAIAKCERGLYYFCSFHFTYSCYRPPRKLLEGNFSVVYVCSQKDSHVIITHDALGLQTQGPPPWIWDLTVQRPLETCSNLLIMKHVRSASGRLTSYKNAFLFLDLKSTHHYSFSLFDVSCNFTLNNLQHANSSILRLAIRLVNHVHKFCIETAR